VRCTTLLLCCMPLAGPLRTSSGDSSHSQLGSSGTLIQQVQQGTAGQSGGKAVQRPAGKAVGSSKESDHSTAVRRPELRWRTEIGRLPSNVLVSGSYLVVTESTGVNRTVRALDPDTGTSVWSNERADHTDQPAVLDNTVYVAHLQDDYVWGEGDIWISGLDLRSGNRLRTYKPGIQSRQPLALLAGKDRLLVVASEWIAALDLKSGRFAWKSAGVFCAPTISGELVYMLDTDGRLRVLNLSDGVLLYEMSVPTSGDRMVSSPPIVNDGKVYVGSPSRNGNYYAFDDHTKRLLWVFKAPGYPSSSVLTGGRIFFRSEGSMCAIDASTGRLLWQVKAGAQVPIGPVESGGVLYFSSFRYAAATRVDSVVAVDTSSGKMLWQRDDPAEIVGTPVIVGSMMYYRTRTSVCALSIAR
jgi:outer membrane protein assembly factor BamB